MSSHFLAFYINSFRTVCLGWGNKWANRTVFYYCFGCKERFLKAKTALHCIWIGWT